MKAIIESSRQVMGSDNSAGSAGRNITAAVSMMDAKGQHQPVQHLLH